VDALNRLLVTMRRDEHNRDLTHFSKPPSNFYPFAATFETDIDENHIRLLPHCKGTRFACARRQGANVEANFEHCFFKVERDQEFVLDDQGATTARKLGHVLLLRQYPRIKLA
jgi:hypothetical protein